MQKSLRVCSAELPLTHYWDYNKYKRLIRLRQNQLKQSERFDGQKLYRTSQIPVGARETKQRLADCYCH